MMGEDYVLVGKLGPDGFDGVGWLADTTVYVKAEDYENHADTQPKRSIHEMFEGLPSDESLIAARQVDDPMPQKDDRDGK